MAYRAIADVARVQATGYVTELLIAVGRSREFQADVKAWLDSLREDPIWLTIGTKKLESVPNPGEAPALSS